VERSRTLGRHKNRPSSEGATDGLRVVSICSFSSGALSELGRLVSLIPVTPLCSIRRSPDYSPFARSALPLFQNSPYLRAIRVIRVSR